MKHIIIKDTAGEFAENKDVARDVRLHQITPALQNTELITLDFAGVTSMTQSFCHALLSEVIRQFGIDVLDKISFANCTPAVQRIIEIVVDYMQ